MQGEKKLMSIKFKTDLIKIAARSISFQIGLNKLDGFLAFW